jgi:2-C-methyl-D-erythritol 4-phosphate cytidylyltransferase/2-C-methyl-D-erythritol 2,4-cyclodiphosphate synthase
MYGNNNVTVLIMAAGSGSRLGAGVPKQFLDVGGEPMILKAARAFEECERVDELWAVAAPDRLSDVDAILGVLPKYRGAVAGDGYRQESVRRGLRAVAGTGRAGYAGDAGRVCGTGPTLVLIHDAARPFVTQDVIARVLEGAAGTGAAVACVPVTDTIYEASGKPWRSGPLTLAQSPPRELLWSVQTPQGFDLDMILAAHEAAAADGFEATDDGAVARAYGGAETLIVMGDYANRKITTPEDLRPAATPDDRVGIGFDVHAFAPAEAGRALVLGGVVLPYARGLAGHSDADVLTHALMDAVLGALALGDIGKMFPDTDEQYRGVSSMKLLAQVRSMAEVKGYIVYNVDTTVIAEKPRMAEHTDAIRNSLAAALGVGADRVGVKATTTEGLGFTGREEGIGAQAVVRLVKKTKGTDA